MSGAGLHAQVRRRVGAFELDAVLQAGDGVTAVFGLSGAGKTQLLSALAGASRPDQGRVSLGARVLFDSATGVDLAMEQRAIGWVFQDGRLFPHLSVEQNLRYGARRARGRDVGVRFGELVETLGVGHLLGRRPGGLSGGERQRVAIGRALLSQPAALLMDEPLAALDLPRRAEILPYLERLKQVVQLPIVYVTHALSEVVRLADSLAVMEAGRIVAQGPVAQVLADASLPILAARPDAAAALELVLAGHDRDRGLSRLTMGDAVLFVPLLPLAPRARVRAAVLARDVLLAVEPPRGLSARNILPAVVESLAPARPDGVVLARVRIRGGAVLLSAVTSDAVRELALVAGTEVFAIIKSVAIEGLAHEGLLQAFES